ncbi:UNVERIFIED_CONTAM: hypothetical protein FKN15_034596 [Acipenser sinensis]
MTTSVFFGCTFIAFGPAISLFLFTIARDPLRVILFDCWVSVLAFFWLVSLLLSSLVWFIAVQISNKENASVQKGLLIFGVVLSVLLQETFRFGYYKLLKRANEGLMALSQEDAMPISIRQLAYVSGLGFGFMSGAFSVVNILADSLGPGTVGIHGDSQHYFVSSGGAVAQEIRKSGADNQVRGIGVGWADFPFQMKKQLLGFVRTAAFLTLCGEQQSTPVQAAVSSLGNVNAANQHQTLICGVLDPKNGFVLLYHRLIFKTFCSIAQLAPS